MATTARWPEKPSETPRSADGVVFGWLLSGLTGGPVCGREFQDAGHEVAALKLVDGVPEVGLGIDAENQAVVHESVGIGEALAAADGAGEEEVAASDGEIANSTLGTAVVDFESTVSETATEEDALVDGVGGGSPESGLGQQQGMDGINPCVQLVEDGQGLLTANTAAFFDGNSVGFAFGFDAVNVGEEFEGNGGATVFGQKRGVEFRPDVHSAAESAFVGHGNQRGTVVVFDFGGISGVPVTLNPAINGRKPVGDFVSLPTWSVTVGDGFWAADRAVGANEAPQVPAKYAVLGVPVEGFEMRVVDADRMHSDDSGGQAGRNRRDKYSSEGPIGSERLFGDVQPLSLI